MLARFQHFPSQLCCLKGTNHFSGIKNGILKTPSYVRWKGTYPTSEWAAPKPVVNLPPNFEVKLPLDYKPKCPDGLAIRRMTYVEREPKEERKLIPPKPTTKENLQHLWTLHRYPFSKHRLSLCIGRTMLKRKEVQRWMRWLREGDLTTELTKGLEEIKAAEEVLVKKKIQDLLKGDLKIKDSGKKSKSDKKEEKKAAKASAKAEKKEPKVKDDKKNAKQEKTSSTDQSKENTNTAASINPEKTSSKDPKPETSKEDTKTAKPEKTKDPKPEKTTSNDPKPEKTSSKDSKPEKTIPKDAKQEKTSSKDPKQENEDTKAAKSEKKTKESKPEKPKK